MVVVSAAEKEGMQDDHTFVLISGNGASDQEASASATEGGT